MSPDEAVAALAAAQHGLITHDGARDAGLSEAAIRHRRRTGRWRDIYRGVYCVAGTPPSREADVLAAVFAYGRAASASHTDAGWLLGLLPPTTVAVHITLPHGEHREARAGVTLHQAELRRSDIRRVGVIPVTCPNRTLVDLAAVLPAQRLEACVDDAILSGLTTALRARAYLIERDLSHRPGVGALFEMLSDRLDGALQLELERMFLRKIKRSRLPTPKAQVRVGRRRLDFAYPEAMIAIELDGRNPHSSGAVFRDDRRRQNELVLAGWYPLRFTWFDVDAAWSSVEQTLTSLLELRARVG